MNETDRPVSIPSPAMTTTSPPSSASPSTSSLSFRANLAKLVSPLRRIRTHTPFFKLAAHRIPTLWQLYRGLLRTAPDEQVKFRVRLAFRQNRHMTSPQDTKEQLLGWYKRLAFFTQAAQGSTHHQNVLARYSRLILLRRDRAHITRLYLEDLDFLESRRNQPINTGTLIRATVLNPPLPRLKPQPQATSMIIMKRRTARSRRHVRKEELEDFARDLNVEAKLEQALMDAEIKAGRSGWESVYCGDVLRDWTRPIDSSINLIRKSQNREYARADLPVPRELIENAILARRERIRNLTNARQRERRGEVLKSTLKRQRKGPPSWVLDKMTSEERDMDRVSRSLSEVGYVAMVKRRLGWKLKGQADVEAEEGMEENRPILDLAMKAVREENMRREEERQEIKKAEKRMKRSTERQGDSGVQVPEKK